MTTTTTVSNPLALVKHLTALKALRDATSNAEISYPTMAAFLFVASRSPNEVGMREIEQAAGISQTATSRNVALLAQYELVKAYVDELYARRKLVVLTPKGAKLASKLSAMVG